MLTDYDGTETRSQSCPTGSGRSRRPVSEETRHDDSVGIVPSAWQAERARSPWRRAAALVANPLPDSTTTDGLSQLGAFGAPNQGEACERSTCT